MAEQPTSDTLSVSITGSGWSCSLAGDEAHELADRLRFEGSWALGYRVRSLGLGTGRTFAKLATYPEDDLFAEEL